MRTYLAGPRDATGNNFPYALTPLREYTLREVCAMAEESSSADGQGSTPVHATIDAQGRIVLPEPIRTFLQVASHAAIAVTLDGGSLEITVQLAPEAVAQYGDGLAPSDETLPSDEELRDAEERAAERVFRATYGRL